MDIQLLCVNINNACIDKHLPLTLDVHIRHKAPGDREKREKSSGCCRTVVVGRRRAGCHRDNVHRSDTASAEQKAAVQEEGFPKAHVIPGGNYKRNIKKLEIQEHCRITNQERILSRHWDILG